MGITPMAAHLFIFYFGLLSFLTPPVAIASFVAAGLAGSNMWTTSWEGVKLASVAYVLPFIWCFNEALLMDGTVIEIVYVVATTFVAALLIAASLQRRWFSTAGATARALACLIAAFVVGGSTIWFGAHALANIAAVAAGIAVLMVVRTLAARARQQTAVQS
jgi:TRAP-type uncharacterized transport system fused permease subunit